MGVGWGGMGRNERGCVCYLLLSSVVVEFVVQYCAAVFLVYMLVCTDFIMYCFLCTAVCTAACTAVCTAFSVATISAAYTTQA